MIKKNIKYVAFLAISLAACEPEFDSPIDGSDVFTSGEADFSKYVALGNSLTAGFADGALYITGQENSYPNILSKQLAKAGGGVFTQPLMADNAGGLLLNGSIIQDPEDGSNRFPNRRVLAFDENGSPSPQIYMGAVPTTDVTNVLSGAFNNMGVPGAKSFHLAAPGYGSTANVALGTANPYFVRFASSVDATIVGDAVTQQPTFFSLWIGNNDILSYATSGGVGMDHNVTGEQDPRNYGSDDITNNITFAGTYTQIINALTANGAKGVVLSIPDVASIPFFTTVPNNALVLDEVQAANLTGFFQAFVGIATQVLASPPNNLPLMQAQAIAAQYAIKFNPGPNRFLVKETSPTNPFGFRQMTEEELLLLTIDSTKLAQGYGSVVLTPEVLQVLGLLQMGGAPTPEQGALVINAVSAIEDKDALDKMELIAIETARISYNASIEAIAMDTGLAFYDAAGDLKQAATEGIPFDGGIITSEFVRGGGFSLDGVHPTPRGHALVANGIIDAIKAKYKAKLPRVDPGDFGTITFNNEVN